MTVRKALIQSKETPEQFENVIKQNDRVERFTIESIDEQIADMEKRKEDVQAEIERLIANKEAAEALK